MLTINQNFRKYLNDDGNEEEFVVFIAHGHSRDWQKINKFIQKELQFNTVVSMKEFGGGNILQKIKDAIWFRCDCAIAILSPDDELHNGVKNARPNVIFELGYCMGFWDSYYWEDEKLEPVIVIKEETVQLNSDLEGRELILYRDDNVSMAYEKLTQGLEGIYNYLNNGKKEKPSIKPSVKVLKNEYAIISHYLKDKNWTRISFKSLKENVHPKFSEAYVMQLVEAFPNKLTRCKLKDNIKGIKLIE